MALSIAIIGAGFSGANLASQLVWAKFPASKIYLIDKSGRFGPGQSFGASQSNYLLNATANRLSADPRDPLDFVNWLRFTSRACADAYAPRAAYGAYLETHMRRVARSVGPDGLELVRDAAVACRRQGDGYVVTLSSGAPLRVDLVVLALGNLPPAPPPPLAQLAEDGGLLDAWDGASLSHVRRDHNILLVGSGLTMIDALTTLASGPREGKVFILSRRGLLPRAHAKPRAPQDRAPFEYEGALSQLLGSLRQEARRASARGEPWQHVMDRLRTDAPRIWLRLSEQDQQRFLRHLRPWWDVHRHRAPQHVEQWVRALQTGGIVEIVAGKLATVARANSGVKVTYRRRGQRTHSVIEATHIVNCTGPCSDIRRSRDPLVIQLRDEGYIAAHPTGLGLKVDADCAVLAATGVPQPELFAIGPLTQGAFWETTAAPEIRAQVTRLVQRLKQNRSLERQRASTLRKGRIARARSAP